MRGLSAAWFALILAIGWCPLAAAEVDLGLYLRGYQDRPIWEFLSEERVLGADEQVESERSGFDWGPLAPRETFDLRRRSRILRDPQGLLDAEVREEQRAFLEERAEGAGIELQIWVAGEGQRILGLEEVPRRVFAPDTPGVVAVYFWGEPGRSQWVASEALKAEISEVALERARRAVVRSAESRRDPEERFAEYCHALVVRLFWMEEDSQVLRNARQRAIASETWAELQEDRIEESSQWYEAWAPWLRRWWMYVAAGLVLTLGVAGWVIWRCFFRPYRFPAVASEPRLGGHWGAGIGPVIHFGSTTESPRRQREPDHDPLGGV